MEARPGRCSREAIQGSDPRDVLPAAVRPLFGCSPNRSPVDFARPAPGLSNQADINTIRLHAGLAQPLGAPASRGMAPIVDCLVQLPIFEYAWNAPHR